MTAALADQDFVRPVLSSVPPDLGDDDLTVDELGSRIVGLAGRLAAATCRWLLLVARFDAREGFGRFGLVSTAQWLSFSCALSHRTAVEHVRVARGLVAFPELAVEMSAGRLSYAQVRAITRVPRDGETHLVSELVNVARHSTASQLETVVRGLRTVERYEASDGERPAEYLAQSWTSQSQWRCHARLDPERGALVRSAISAVAKAEGLGQADALVRMAELALTSINDSERPPRAMRGHELAAVVIHLDAAAVPAGGDGPGDRDDPLVRNALAGRGALAERDHGDAGVAEAAVSDGDEAPGAEGRSADDDGNAAPSADRAGRGSAVRVEPTADDAPRPRSAERGRGAEPTADDARRPRSAERGRPFARIADGPGLSRDVVERLLCAARIRTAVHDGPGNVRDLGRSRRVVSERQFRALLLKYGGHCAHPGCTSRAGLEAHHVRHWLYGGCTDLANLVLLCRAHHRGHHAGEFRIKAMGGGRFAFFRHDGRLLEQRVDPARLADRAEPVETEFAATASDAATPRWTGERLDHDYAVTVLAHHRNRWDPSS